MKRTHKAGDWFRIPLSDGETALGLIARMAGSRLFVYCFRDVHEAPPFPSLRPHAALWRGLTNGTAIEGARWQVVSRSFSIDVRVWPLPLVVHREPFARSYTLYRLDEASLQLERLRESTHPDAAMLPDARIVEPVHLETQLEHLLRGDSNIGRRTVVDLQPPLIVPDGDIGRRMQMRMRLSSTDARELARAVQIDPTLQLRFYGCAGVQTLEALAAFAPPLRHLELDGNVESLRALAAFRATLQSLTLGIGVRSLSGLPSLPKLERLVVRCSGELPEAVVSPCLREVVIAGDIANAGTFVRAHDALETLEIVHCAFDVRAPQALAHLRRLTLDALPSLHRVDALAGLRLHSLSLRRLRDVAQLDALVDVPLRMLHIEDLPEVRSLEAIARMQQLRSLSVRRMSHLNVADFTEVVRLPDLRSLNVDLGSRRKNREVYRAWRAAVVHSTT